MTLYDDLFQCSNKLWEMISLERVKFFTYTYITYITYMHTLVFNRFSLQKVEFWVYIIE